MKRKTGDALPAWHARGRISPAMARLDAPAGSDGYGRKEIGLRRNALELLLRQIITNGRISDRCRKLVCSRQAWKANAAHLLDAIRGDALAWNFAARLRARHHAR